ncbi:MAG: lytic transglycosylase domain-containing protein, partial [Pseudomonadota bacterium]
MSRFALALVALILLSVAAMAERPRPLGWAMDALRNGNWDVAASLAARDGAVAADVIEWQRLRAGRGSETAVRAFLERRPNWPGEAFLRRKSEPAIGAAGPDAIIAFYGDELPQTALGALDYAAAQIAAGNEGDAHATIVLAWRGMPMRAGTQARFVAQYSDLIAPHHTARTSALLWTGDRESARRMLDLIPEGQAHLARARIALQSRASNVNALIDKVPASLQSDGGLAHDRFEWRIRNRQWAGAKDLLFETSRSADALGTPEAWANRRRAMVRDEMRDGDPARAYQLAARHFLSEGSNYADLEWLAGYIALRKLGDPELALGHFQNHRNAIASPISRGRAGYWIGRAHEAAGNA